MEPLCKRGAARRHRAEGGNIINNFHDTKWMLTVSTQSLLQDNYSIKHTIMSDTCPHIFSYSTCFLHLCLTEMAGIGLCHLAASYLSL